MKTYIVTGLVTISVSTRVEAESEEAAKEAAMERGMIGLCHQCASGRTKDNEWVTSGELDGTPEDLGVSEERRTPKR